MPEELRLKQVPITDGKVTSYADTYVLSEYDLITGNATVPSNAPVQPPQAFVNLMLQRSLGTAPQAFQNPNTDMYAVGMGITHFSTAIIQTSINYYGLPDLFVQNNSIPSSDVNALLALYVAHSAEFQGGQFIDTSGQNPPAPPTGQGIADKATLIGLSWSVTTD